MKEVTILSNSSLGGQIYIFVVFSIPMTTDVRNNCIIYFPYRGERRSMKKKMSAGSLRRSVCRDPLKLARAGELGISGMIDVFLLWGNHNLGKTVMDASEIPLLRLSKSEFTEYLLSNRSNSFLAEYIDSIWSEYGQQEEGA